SYLAEKNFVAVEKFSRQLLEKPATPGRREFKSDLVKFKTGAMFKLAEALDQKGEYEGAAELYLKLLDENPSTQFADSALNNAAVAYEKVKRYDSASRLYERMVRDYPKSPLADTALFRVGLNAERFFDFDKAIAVYLQLVEKYPKSERRADAIYNAATSLENTQRYEQAATQYLRYCQLFPKRDDAPKVCFRAGVAYEKMGTPAKVVVTYEAFVRRYRGTSSHTDRVVEAYLKVAAAQEKLSKPALAKKAYEEALKAYKRGESPEAALFAAQAQFQLVERDFDDFRKLKIDGNSKQQKKQMTLKAERLKKVETAYKGVLRFKQIDWSLGALYRIGQLYQQFSSSLLAAPCPPEIKRAAKQMGATAAEVCDEYRALLEERSFAVEDKAVGALEATLSYAREYQVANRWTEQTRVALNKLRPKAWPLQKDAKSFVDEVTPAWAALVDTAPSQSPPPPTAEVAP
ncbi:MAG: tetratricopeptide repeat protein, partial [Myxococcota bacterium]